MAKNSFVVEVTFNEFNIFNIQKFTVACTNPLHDITDLINNGMVKNRETEIS